MHMHMAILWHLVYNGHMEWAHDTTFARSARNNWIPKHDRYIHTHTNSKIRCRISCLCAKAFGNNFL